MTKCAQTVGINDGDTPRGSSTSVSHITIIDYHIGTTNVKKERDFPYKMTSIVSTP